MITKEQVLKLDPAKDKKVIAQFFHNFCYAIPEDQWCRWQLVYLDANLGPRHCVRGHVMSKLDGTDLNKKACWPPLEGSMDELLVTTFGEELIMVNNGSYVAYTEETQRGRVLHYLQDQIEGVI